MSILSSIEEKPEPGSPCAECGAEYYLWAFKTKNSNERQALCVKCFVRRCWGRRREA